jgi:hypothetical protein
MDTSRASGYLYNPDLQGESVVAFVNVENTNDPLSKVNELSRWITESLNYLNSKFRDGSFEIPNGPFFVRAEMAMVVLVFHGEPQDLDTMLELRDGLRPLVDPINLSSIPVLIVWENEDGEVFYSCISGCSNVTRRQMGETACAMLGYPKDCTAWNADELAQNTDQAGSNTSLAVVTPTLPPSLSGPCAANQVCIMSIESGER